MESKSFSRSVKEELISKINSPAKAQACLYGMLLCSNELSADEILLLTELSDTADFFKFNVEKLCGRDSVEVHESGRGSGQVMYSLTIPDRQAREDLLNKLFIGEGRKRKKENFPKKSLIPQMIAGMYLACGSVSDPNKGYHMEFVMPELELCNYLGLLLIESFDMLAKHVERKGHQILYFKESDNIMDMLALMGATSSYFDLFYVKQMKDMRNKINRGVNCVNANIEKSIRAAEKQIADIELIDEVRGLDTLPDNLREMAVLRYENPEMNLSELGAALTPPISRSGANHRLQKLAFIAEEIRKAQEKQ